MKAYLVADDQLWLKIQSLRESPQPPCAIEAIRFDVGYNVIPIIRSPYLTTACDYEPPRILKDFDRWFDAKLREIGWRREEEKLRRRRQSLDSAML
jgi:hypothetical protein